MYASYDAGVDDEEVWLNIHGDPRLQTKKRHHISQSEYRSLKHHKAPGKSFATQLYCRHVAALSAADRQYIANAASYRGYLELLEVHGKQELFRKPKVELTEQNTKAQPPGSTKVALCGMAPVATRHHEVLQGDFAEIILGCSLMLSLLPGQPANQFILHGQQRATTPTQSIPLYEVAFIFKQQPAVSSSVPLPSPRPHQQPCQQLTPPTLNEHQMPHRQALAEESERAEKEREKSRAETEIVKVKAEKETAVKDLHYKLDLQDTQKEHQHYDGVPSDGDNGDDEGKKAAAAEDNDGEDYEDDEDDYEEGDDYYDEEEEYDEGEEGDNGEEYDEGEEGDNGEEEEEEDHEEEEEIDEDEEYDDEEEDYDDEEEEEVEAPKTPDKNEMEKKDLHSFNTQNKTDKKLD